MSGEKGGALPGALPTSWEEWLTLAETVEAWADELRDVAEGRGTREAWEAWDFCTQAGARLRSVAKAMHDQHTTEGVAQ